MPVSPLCHGAWYSQVGVPGLVAQRVDQVGVEVGHVLRVQRLDPAEADHPRRHPVGQDDHVAVDRLAGAELVAHLGVELGVVVDVDPVVDRDAGLAPGTAGSVDAPASAGRCRPVQLEMMRFGSLAETSVGPARERVLLRPVDGEQRQLERGHAETGERDNAAPLEQPASRQGRRVAGVSGATGTLLRRPRDSRIVPPARPPDKRYRRIECRSATKSLVLNGADL